MIEEIDNQTPSDPPVGSAPAGSVSDTPRTDAHQLKEHMAYDHLWSDFARQLERELNQANAIIAAYPAGAIETLRKWYAMKLYAENLKKELDRMISQNDDHSNPAPNE